MNNGGGGPTLGTPSKRAEKKQDTRSTPERMKPKETEMMEIDSDDGQVPKTPPRLYSINKEERKIESKAGKTSDMAIDCNSTPPSTPGRKEDKGQKKASPSKKKPGPKFALSKKEKQTFKQVA